jgi:hypothetical protein
MTTIKIHNECVDDPPSTFKDGEVRAMNDDYRKEQQELQEAHQ